MTRPRATSSTAGPRALAQRTPPDELANAHRRAAGYWRWRFDTVPQSREQDVEDLLEARYHHHEAGDLDQAIAVTEHVCLQLDTWGAWQREERLCREVLDWVPERSPDAAKFLHQLGMVAQARGDYDRALDWYRQSLAIEEALGNRAGMASSYGQFGVLYTDRGQVEAAVPFNLRSLAIRLEIGSPEARIDLHWLSRQREALGAERFRRVLAEHLSEADAARVIELLDEYAARAAKS